jgi:ADP-ribose pyrophosphatase YjhB (NUDIX family)
MHIRVSAIIIENGNLLLLPHYYKNGILWHLPGGKIQENESAEEALIRELSEELGIQYQIQTLSFVCMEYQKQVSEYVLHLTFLAKKLVVDSSLPLRLLDSRAKEPIFLPLNDVRGKTLYPNIANELLSFFENDPNHNQCHYLGTCVPRPWL